MKKLLIALTVILVPALSIFGWLTYRDYRSYKYALPANTELAVRLDVDQLLRKGLWYKIKNPSTWFGDRDTTDPDRDAKKRGIPIPANLFAFTLPDQPEYLYLRLPITDLDRASEYLTRLLDLSEYKMADRLLIGRSKSMNVKVVLNEQQLILCYFTNGEIEDNKLAGILQAVSEELPVDEQIQDMISNSADMAAVFRGMQIQLSVHENVVEMTVKAGKTKFDLTGLPVVGPSIENQLNETLKYAIRESIRFQVMVEGSVEQTDSITTYEFNDDFEKIEKKEINTFRVPGVEIHMTLGPDGNTAKRVSDIKDQFHRIGLYQSDHAEEYMCFRNTDLKMVDSEHEFRLQAYFSSLDPGVIQWSNVALLQELKSLNVESIPAQPDSRIYKFELELNKNVFELLFDRNTN